MDTGANEPVDEPATSEPAPASITPGMMEIDPSSVYNDMLAHMGTATELYCATCGRVITRGFLRESAIHPTNGIRQLQQPDNLPEAQMIGDTWEHYRATAHATYTTRAVIVVAAR